jgi:hypothetical protein
MDNPELLATLGTQDKGQRQTKQKNFSQKPKQSISPALVETEFAARMHKDEERAKNLYSSFKVILIQYIYIYLFQYFSYILSVSLIGEGNRRIQRKPRTCPMSLTNFIT